jgi:hypothetical protein
MSTLKENNYKRISVEAKSDIPKEIFNALKKDSLRVAGILYAPPNFLRMSMYLELSVRLVMYHVGRKFLNV